MKKILLVFCLVLISGMLYSFDWVQLNEFEKTYAAPTVKVLSSTRERTVVKVDVNGFAKMPEKAGKVDCYRIAMADTHVTREKGKPELPYISFNVVIPDNSQVKVSVKENTTAYSLDKPVLPSKGPILRNKNPDKVPYTFGDIYKNNAYYPAEDIKAGKPFVLRSFHGVRVIYSPVKYSAGNNALVVAKTATIVIDTPSNTESIQLRKKVEKEYSNIYKSSFMNFSQVMPDNAYDPVAEKGYLHIITPDKFAPAVKPLVDWKKKTGYKVKVAVLSEIGKTGTKIKEYIQSEYDKGELCYVILIGDNEFVPCLRGVKENAPSDTMYTKLAGDDNIPDAMISRFSAKNIADVEYQVYKSVQYEKNPLQGDDGKFYEVGMGIASHEGNPTDYERAEELREALLAFTYKTVHKVYATSYSQQPSTSTVIKNINDGCALMNYIGHGSKTMIVTSRFGVNDMDKLHNGLKLPVMWDVACVNGQFNIGSDCFAEAFVKAGTKEAPAGAAVVYAATTNQEWVPPCVVQQEINNEIICNEKFTTVGGISANGILKGFEVYGDGNNTSGTMMLEQWTLFGDCSLTFRSKTPEKISLKASKRGENIMVEVNGSSRALKNATVTCYDKDLNEVEVSNLVDGRCSFNRSSEKTTYVSVSGFNLVPVIDSEVK